MTYDMAVPDADSRNLAVVAHLAAYSGLILPVVAPFLIPALLVAMRSDDAYLREHAIESLNFQISMWLFAALFGSLSFFLVGLPFLLAIAAMGLIMPIFAAVDASKGLSYRYPLTLRLIS